MVSSVARGPKRASSLGSGSTRPVGAAVVGRRVVGLDLELFDEVFVNFNFRSSSCTSCTAAAETRTEATKADRNEGVIDRRILVVYCYTEQREKETEMTEEGIGREVSIIYFDTATTIRFG
mmetsp:Transcript_9934/g.11460  ORF Transcript_9934/g.11460 Transcript_9934/m.11460 type:complete len:121 (+) Transcript_9934:86-448(+)